MECLACGGLISGGSEQPSAILSKATLQWNDDSLLSYVQLLKNDNIDNSYIKLVKSFFNEEGLM